MKKKQRYILKRVKFRKQIIWDRKATEENWHVFCFSSKIPLFLQNNFQALLQISPQIKLVLRIAKLDDIAINWGQWGLTHTG